MVKYSIDTINQLYIFFIAHSAAYVAVNFRQDSPQHLWDIRLKKKTSSMLKLRSQRIFNQNNYRVKVVRK